MIPKVDRSSNRIQGMARGQLGHTYLAVNSSNVSSCPCDASWPSLSAASFALVLKLLALLAAPLGTLATTDREQRGAAWRIECDRKVVRAATRRMEVGDIGNVGGGCVTAGEVGLER